MFTTSFYVLCRLATGSETRYESLDDAFAAVNTCVKDGEEWIVTEFDNHRAELPRSDRRHADRARLVAEGCGRATVTRRLDRPHIDDSPTVLMIRPHRQVRAAGSTHGHGSFA